MFEMLIVVQHRRQAELPRRRLKVVGPREAGRANLVKDASLLIFAMRKTKTIKQKKNKTLNSRPVVKSFQSPVSVNPPDVPKRVNHRFGQVGPGKEENLSNG